MLPDAALLQLDLSRAALAEGVLTKDATSYNVQFDGLAAGLHRPRVLRAPRARRAVGRATASSASCSSTRSTCRPSPTSRSSPGSAGRCNGISPTLAAARPRWPQAASGATCSPTCASTPAPRPATPTPTPSRDVRGELEAGGLRSEDHRRPDGQPPARPSSASSGRRRRRPGRATATAATTPTATSTRRTTFVARGHRVARRTRWCSTSAPTTAASPAWPSSAGASLAIAVDGDHLVVDHLYRQLRAEGERRILPLVLDLADPSPGARLAVAGAAVVRRPGAARPRALPGRDPPPRALATRCRSTRSWPSSTTSARRSSSRCPTATTRWPPACSAASGPGCSTTTTARSGRPRSRGASTVARAGDAALGHPHALPLPPRSDRLGSAHAAAGPPPGPAAPR